jgi:homoserine dehydrogenase
LEKKMTHYKLAFLGFGNVGKALGRLLLAKQDELQTRYRLTFSVTGIATGRRGAVINPGGLNLQAALDGMSDPAFDLRSLGSEPTPTDSFDFIRRSGADVLFENSPVNYDTGQPAVDHIRLALELGMHVATANKGPVVHAYHELTALARTHGRKFYFESTTMDGAPIYSLFRETLPAANLIRFRGILNSTTNLILSMMEDGSTFDAAVKHCQEIGLAETDPSGDIDGWDAAVKVAALATVLMDAPLKPQQVEKTGIRGIGPAEIAQARAAGKRWKLICEAERTPQGVMGRVYPLQVEPASPMYAVDGSTSIIQFETDVLGKLSMIEEDPGTHTTAYGLLQDFLNAVRER